MTHGDYSYFFNLLSMNELLSTYPHQKNFILNSNPSYGNEYAFFMPKNQAKMMNMAIGSKYSEYLCTTEKFYSREAASDYARSKCSIYGPELMVLRLNANHYTIGIYTGDKAVSADMCFPENIRNRFFIKIGEKYEVYKPNNEYHSRLPLFMFSGGKYIDTGTKTNIINNILDFENTTMDMSLISGDIINFNLKNFTIDSIKHHKSLRDIYMIKSIIDKLDVQVNEFNGYKQSIYTNYKSSKANLSLDQCKYLAELKKSNVISEDYVFSKEKKRFLYMNKIHKLVIDRSFHATGRKTEVYNSHKNFQLKQNLEDFLAKKKELDNQLFKTVKRFGLENSNW